MLNSFPISLICGTPYSSFWDYPARCQTGGQPTWHNSCGPQVALSLNGGAKAFYSHKPLYWWVQKRSFPLRYSREAGLLFMRAQKVKSSIAKQRHYSYGSGCIIPSFSLACREHCFVYYVILPLVIVLSWLLLWTSYIICETLWHYSKHTGPIGQLGL